MRATFRCASSRRIVAERVNEAGEERGRRSETVLRGDFCAVKRIAAGCRLLSGLHGRVILLTCDGEERIVRAGI